MASSDHLLPVALRNRTSFVLIRLAAVIRQHCADQLASLGLNQHQHAILCCLEEFGPACQKDIAVRLNIDGGDIVAFIDGLQHAGLITRERDQRDRRRQIVSLTTTGLGLLRQVEKALDHAEPDALAVLTAQQRAQVHAAATQVLMHHAPGSWAQAT